MKKSILVFICLTALISCKKKSNDTSNTTNGGSGGGSTTPSSFYGFFRHVGIQSLSSGNIPGPMFEIAYASFMNSANANLNLSNVVTVDSVKVNGALTNYSMPYYQLMASGFTYNWDVYGNNGIADFTYAQNDAMPSFSGYANYPNSVSKSSTFTINVSGASNFNTGLVVVSDSTGLHSASASFTSNGIQTISPSTMSTLLPCSNGFVNIILYKHSYANFGSKDFKFTTELQSSKSIAITN